MNNMNNILNNIFKVLNETDLNDVLNNHKYNIVIMMFSSDKCQSCKIIKPFYINMSKHFNNEIFIYIDVDNFVHTSNKYINNVDVIPKFIFLYNLQEIASVGGSDKNLLIDTLNEIIGRLNTLKTQMNKFDDSAFEQIYNINNDKVCNINENKSSNVNNLINNNVNDKSISPNIDISNSCNDKNKKDAIINEIIELHKLIYGVQIKYSKMLNGLKQIKIMKHNAKE